MSVTLLIQGLCSIPVRVYWLSARLSDRVSYHRYFWCAKNTDQSEKYFLIVWAKVVIISCLHILKKFVTKYFKVIHTWYNQNFAHMIKKIIIWLVSILRRSKHRWYDRLPHRRAHNQHIWTGIEHRPWIIRVTLAYQLDYWASCSPEGFLIIYRFIWFKI